MPGPIVPIRRPIIPSSGLDIEPWIADYLTLDARVINVVLALLSGQGPDGSGQLLQTDSSGRLLLSAAIPPVIEITDGAGGGQLARVAPSSDALGSGANGIVAQAFSYVFDTGLAVGVRERGASAANLALQSGMGAALATPPGMWVATSNPAAGSVSVAQRAAGGAGVRHVCWGFGFSVAATAAPALTQVNVSLKDGGTGGTVLMAFALAIPAGTGILIPATMLSSINIPGSAATAMTVDFSAGVANALESTFLIGYDVS